jgi:hypothetical protein
MFPDWYNTTEFSSDSSAYYGFGTAVASDSAFAIHRAEIQARINLESKIAELTEEVRIDLVSSGSISAGNTDFIIILRTAHAGVEHAAQAGPNLTSNRAGVYRAFTMVQITKNDLVNVLEHGFAGHPSYWGEFSVADKFTNFFR